MGCQKAGDARIFFWGGCCADLFFFFFFVAVVRIYFFYSFLCVCGCCEVLFLCGCGRLSTLPSWPLKPLLWLQLYKEQELPSSLSAPSCEEAVYVYFYF